MTTQSSIKIRVALETALNAMTPSLATVWENHPYTPVVGTPFQRATLMLAEPDHIEITGHLFVQRGIFQVTLAYPPNAGPNPAQARAELLRSTFFHGAYFSSGDLVVNVIGTPEIGTGQNEEDRYMLPVSVRFSAQVNRS